LPEISSKSCEYPSTPVSGPDNLCIALPSATPITASFAVNSFGFFFTVIFYLYSSAPALPERHAKPVFLFSRWTSVYGYEPAAAFYDKTGLFLCGDWPADNGKSGAKPVNPVNFEDLALALEPAAGITVKGARPSLRPVKIFYARGRHSQSSLPSSFLGSARSSVRLLFRRRAIPFFSLCYGFPSIASIPAGMSFLPSVRASS